MNRKEFYTGYRKKFGHLKQSQVEGIELILDYYDKNCPNMSLEMLAYILATAKYESGHTFQPVRERRAGWYQPRIRKMQDKYWDSGYYGRGLVQLTWYNNYKVFSEYIGINLLTHPDYALIPYVSVKILFEGMRHGLFTRKRLLEFINGDKIDYIGARKVVNGTFHANKVAKIAEKFRIILTSPN